MGGEALAEAGRGRRQPRAALQPRPCGGALRGSRSPAPSPPSGAPAGASEPRPGSRRAPSERRAAGRVAAGLGCSLGRLLTCPSVGLRGSLAGSGVKRRCCLFSVASLESCAERLLAPVALPPGRLRYPHDGRLDGAHRGGAPRRRCQRGLPAAAPGRRRSPSEAGACSGGRETARRRFPSESESEKRVPFFSFFPFLLMNLSQLARKALTKCFGTLK